MVPFIQDIEGNFWIDILFDVRNWNEINALTSNFIMLGAQLSFELTWYPQILLYIIIINWNCIKLRDSVSLSWPNINWQDRHSITIPTTPYDPTSNPKTMWSTTVHCSCLLSKNCIKLRDSVFHDQTLFEWIERKVMWETTFSSVL